MPALDKLETLKLHLLDTDLGPLDVLTTVGNGWTYDDLIARTNEHLLGELRVRTLDLDTLIETKRHADRPKDRMALAILQQIRELKPPPE